MQPQTVTVIFKIPSKHYDTHKRIFGLVRKNFDLKCIDKNGKVYFLWWKPNNTISAIFDRDKSGNLKMATVTYIGTNKGDLLKMLRELFGEYEVGE